MKTFRMKIGAFGATVAVWVLLAAVPALAFGGSRVDSSSYVYKHVDGTDLTLDVYAPAVSSAGGKRYPAVILFHGGAWKAGNRHQMRFQCLYFAARGMVAVTCDYRLMAKDASLKDTQRIMCLIDAKSAVRWVKSHAASLHIDTGNIVLGGGSAGGQLATMVALDRDINDPADDRSVSTRPQALVLFNPAYQLDDDPRLEPFRFAPGSFPPAIMFFGSKDHWKHAGDSCFRRLSRAGAPVQMWVAPGQSHGFFNKQGWNSSTARQAASFLHAWGLCREVREPSPEGYLLVRQPGAKD